VTNHSIHPGRALLFAAQVLRRAARGGFGVRGALRGAVLARSAWGPAGWVRRLGAAAPGGPLLSCSRRRGAPGAPGHWGRGPGREVRAASSCRLP